MKNKSMIKRNVVFSLLLGMTSLSALAGEVEPFEIIMDNYIGYGAGAGNDFTGGDTYNIKALTADRRTEGASTYLDVYVDTNFTAQENSNGKINYGDLFVTTADNYDPNRWSTDTTLDTTFYKGSLNSNTRWEYAFDINNSGDRWDPIKGSGNLKELDISNDNKYANSLKTAAEFNSSRDGRAEQAVKVKNVSTSVGAGTWSNNIGGGQNGANNRITFSFEVTGTVLSTANQLAFRWAMTCANDIIEGLTSIKSGKPPGPSVPEPSTIVLMALAMAGLIYRRKTV